MKRKIFTAVFAVILLSSCKENNPEEIAKQDLIKSNIAFMNSSWDLKHSGDSIKDRFIGLWLAREVRYNEVQCNECDSLFTWVIESSGRMVKRNNDGGDNGTRYGDWLVIKERSFILFNHKYILPGGGSSYIIVTDTIRIENINQTNFTVSEFINSQTKLGINFSRIK